MTDTAFDGERDGNKFPGTGDTGAAPAAGNSGGGGVRTWGELVPASEALEIALAAASPVDGVERVPLHDALGRVLARKVELDVDLPPFPRSTMDGYAVRAADVAGAGPGSPVTLNVAGDVAMGEGTDLSVSPGEAVGIPTGGILPPGADAVVIIEHTRPAAPGDKTVTVVRPAAPDENILHRGADGRAGDAAAAAGTPLTPARIGVLAAAGCAEPVVYRRPRVAIIATGDELIPFYRRPRGGEIRDSNSLSLAAAVRRDGGEPRIMPTAGDTLGALGESLDQAGDCDLILISGGSSVGRGDLTKEAVMALPGARLLLHGIAIRPGKPTLLVRRERQIIVGLPGNPVSGLVIYEWFVRPVLQKMAGIAEPAPLLAVRARLTAPAARPPSREELVRVRLTGGGARGYEAEPLPRGSALLRAMSWADGLLYVTWDEPRFEAGETVSVRVLPR